MPVEVVSDVRAANIAAVTAAIGRRVLPLVDDEALAASCVVEEECGHWTRSRTPEIAGCEVAVNESAGRAGRAWGACHA